jgi:ATP-dependent RNA helicase DeaD
MTTFKELGLMPGLIKGIEDLGFENPTPVQKEVIPEIFNTTKDIVALAQTGTGKTAAFGLPLLGQVEVFDRSVQTLIVAPTRELCVQIAGDLQNYAKYLDELSVVPVYGGASIDIQIRALRRGAHIVVATPGRMVDLLKRKAVNISQIKTVVLDEAD